MSRKVLVSGGCGYIGTRLVRRLLELGDDPYVVDDLSTGRLEGFPEKVFVRLNDIADPSLTLPRPDLIYHLAALSRIGLCDRDHERARLVNEIATCRILQYASTTKARIVFTSSCCALAPDLSLYGNTKEMGETLCESFARFDRLDVRVARLFNVYGPEERDAGPTGTVVARFARARREGKPLQVAGNGLQSRDFVHVDDVVDALVLLGGDSAGPEFYDVGTGQSLAIKTLAQMFDAKFECDMIPRSGEMLTARADVRAISSLGWRPKYDLLEYVRSLK